MTKKKEPITIDEDFEFFEELAKVPEEENRDKKIIENLRDMNHRLEQWLLIYMEVYPYSWITKELRDSEDNPDVFSFLEELAKGYYTR